MDSQALLLVMVCCATAHVVTASVIGIYARYKVQYLSLMWVNAIFAFAIIAASPFYRVIAEAQPDFMHPLMLVTLMGVIFLQSIYPLSVPMPGFLQWGRMLRYAIIPIIIIIAYVALAVVMGKETILSSPQEVVSKFYHWDVFLRLAALLSCIYYIVNIFRLPHVMAHKANVPTWLIGYCSALSLVMIFYVYVSISYSTHRIAIYMILLTLLNTYLVFRTLEDMASHLPGPTISEDMLERDDFEELSIEKSVQEKDEKDFNELNLMRFQATQHWMLNNKGTWLNSTFGRDQLCKELGLNRHILLQSLRSQGFNNVHDYIVSYRVAELKRLIRHGEVTQPSESTVVGFCTLITARNCFQRVEGISLDDFIARYEEKNRLANK